MAINALKYDDFNTALNLLKKSESACENNETGRAMTYNNLACYYRKAGKLRTAL